MSQKRAKAAKGLRKSVSMTRAYRRLPDGTIEYCVVAELAGVLFTVLSNWTSDDNYNQHISQHMKSFKLQPERVRLFQTKVFLCEESPFVIDDSFVFKGARLALVKETNNRVALCKLTEDNYIAAKASIGYPHIPEAFKW